MNFKIHQILIYISPEQAHNSLSDCMAQVANVQKFLHI